MESVVPIVDFGPFKLGTTADVVQPSDEVLALSTEIVHALQTVGFIYFTNHGVSETLIENAFEKSLKFFLLPESSKKKFSRPAGIVNHGWCQIEREKLNPERPNDYKEAFDVNPLQGKCWPSDGLVDGFQHSLESLYFASRQLSLRILDLIALGMNFQDVKYFSVRHDITKPTYTALRSLYYPPLEAMPKGLKEKQLRCAEHTDYGSLTILYQDEAGGLEVFSQQSGGYVPAPPVKGAVLVNLGDLMQRWTADNLKSTKHRVVNPVNVASTRQSIVCFVHPEADCLVECTDGSQKYPPITAKDYIDRRFTETEI